MGYRGHPLALRRVVMNFKTDQTEGTRLVLEWNNQCVSKDKFTSAFLAAFTLFWAAFVSFLSFHYLMSVFLGEKLALLPMLFVTSLIGLAYVVMYGLLATWLARFSCERLMLDESHYSHSFSHLPQLLTKSGATDQLTIYFGTHRKEHSPSLSLYVNGRRDILAHGSSERCLIIIFEKINRHVEASGIKIEMVDSR